MHVNIQRFEHHTHREDLDVLVRSERMAAATYIAV